MISSLRSVADLETYLATQHLTWEDCHLPSRRKLATGFPLRIPVHYARLINWQNANDPLRKMVIQDQLETETQEYELTDPIGDHNREVVPGLVHRYPDRCLLLLTSYCLVHCRFCFRKEVVGKVRPIAFQKIITYLKQHPEIHEIIFSGGDPATMPAGFLKSVANSFQGLKHIQRYRFHTRVPVVDPETITEEWLNSVESLPAAKKIVVLHVNHAQELSPETASLVKKLLDRHILVLSQTVLLKGVNDSTDALTHLFIELVNIGVKPYYLHHLDKARGTHHFRLSIEAGKNYTQV